MRTCEVITSELQFPEGPAFDRHGRLWCVELEASSLTRIEPDGSLTRFETGGVPDGLAIDRDGNFYVCDKKKKILRLPAGGRQFETLATAVDGKELHNPGDCAFDPAGDLLFTCLGEFGQPVGYVCRLTRAGRIEKVADRLTFPNGLAFDATGTRIYVAETSTRKVLTSDYNTGGMLNLQPFAEVGGSTGPDGMALDAGGNLHVAIFGWAQIAVVAPDGRIVDRIGLPGGKPTNCAFDPAGTLGLVATEAELGRLLSIRPAPPGLPPLG